ncbi:MAG: hypothetical protein IT423_19060, partial [Pirellulaceae bacterium]|nr:hypothetical protein [Pirellulaceae bacterium]
MVQVKRPGGFAGPFLLSEHSALVITNMTTWTRRSTLRGMTRLEVIVAAVALLIILVFLLPLIQESRLTNRRILCLERLRALGAANAQFENVNKKYPGYVQA